MGMKREAKKTNLYGNEKGSKKDKKGQKAQKA
jgi:hypothetical protein